MNSQTTKLHTIRIHATELKPMHDFYSSLGFQCSLETNALNLSAGFTNLSFQKHPKSAIYHFAFLIPLGRVSAAMDFLKTKGIPVLGIGQTEIVEFTDGRAVYFNDPNNNIVEFIERPILKTTKTSDFSIDEVHCINEIGCPTASPMETAALFKSSGGIKPMPEAFMTENFCWLGDMLGAFIVSKIGRNWLPTEQKATGNAGMVTYSSEGEMYECMLGGGEPVIKKASS
ncbi:hypothetical protein [Persicobacter psychrovividus]|uniref:VOC domain-containing protein n=1 Tax=Persicobacter psychrovividus TaxID=387638 RepID=A0ABM7VEE3_9BACT|nr:hypothetical protein PEPS_16000 [Persicobacter psychrovividus]